MTPASACPTFRAQPAPVQRLVPEGRRVTPGCCWPWSAAWHDVEPAVRARRPGTREYPAPADDAPSDSGARAGTTPYRRSSGCGPQRPPARTTSGTPYTAASIGSRLSSRKCPRARLAPSRHPAAGSTRPPPDRASRRAAPDTLGSTSAAVPRRSSGATGPEFRRSLDPGHAAAKDPPRDHGVPGLEAPYFGVLYAAGEEVHRGASTVPRPIRTGTGNASGHGVPGRPRGGGSDAICPYFGEDVVVHRGVSPGSGAGRAGGSGVPSGGPPRAGPTEGRGPRLPMTLL